MANCGCTMQGYNCLVGVKLMARASAFCEAIESTFFLTLSQSQREQIWKEYNGVVAAYMLHCGYGVETIVL